MSKLTSALVTRSRSRRTSPAGDVKQRCRRGGQGGGDRLRSPLPGAVGHWPATRTAWLAISPMEAAWRSGVLPCPALAGDAGSAPGTSPSGSDQNASWKLNGMPGIAAAIRDRSAALPGAAWLGSLTSAVTDNAVSGAVTRSCRTASGRAWPVNTASAAATAAVTRVVSAAAASTTQCAVIRRVAIGPRGLITAQHSVRKPPQSMPYVARKEELRRQALARREPGEGAVPGSGQNRGEQQGHDSRPAIAVRFAGFSSPQTADRMFMRALSVR